MKTAIFAVIITNNMINQSGHMSISDNSEVSIQDQHKHQ